ncbi:hypothetical protein [Pseudomonas sp. EA_15y_Pfl2_R67]|uniref:hypothetical protein n=1 Tax=Pseudomonas sp. EA_15y_Pfl2_R67 TaxID=3088687 RepID=UPI0030D7BB41
MPLFGSLFTRNPAPNYVKEFADALKRTRSWHLSPPEFGSSSNRYLSEDATVEIGRRWQDIYRGHAPEVFAGKCFEVAGTMQKPLEDILGVPLAFTLGYVKFHGRPVFHTPTKKLKPMLKQNLALQAVNLHAWLTLPSHEIIDLTFFTTVGVHQQTPDYIGMACIGHSNEIQDFLSYHPQLVGDGFLKKTGVLLEGMFLLSSN